MGSENYENSKPFNNEKYELIKEKQSQWLSKDREKITIAKRPFKRLSGSCRSIL